MELRDELPKSNVGKVLRRELRDESGNSEAVAARPVGDTPSTERQSSSDVS